MGGDGARMVGVGVRVDGCGVRVVGCGVRVDGCGVRVDLPIGFRQGSRVQLAYFAQAPTGSPWAQGLVSRRCLSGTSLRHQGSANLCRSLAHACPL